MARDPDRRRIVELVVHDLRNPLSALLGQLDLLREELLDSTPTVKEGLDDCQQLTTRALMLVATILDVEELEMGDLTVERESVDVGELVTVAVTRNAAGVRVRELRVELDVPDGFRAPLDPDLAERVLEHLVDNAVRYARRRGRVVISARDLGDSTELAVGNDGPPVPPAEREAIFARHYRAEARRATAHKGLGLYFCRLAVEAHGGTIGVEQRGELGAVFVATFPKA